MKRLNLSYSILLTLIGAILFLGFTFNNSNLRPEIFTTLPDSLQNNNGGRMTGNGMMGRGMMNGNMMGRGMMNNSGSDHNKTDKNGNWIAPKKANELTNPLKKIAEASRKGKAIFNSQCFTCHGIDGKGDGPAAVSLNPKPANLISSRVQKESDGAIFWKITNGNSPMPSFKNGLSKKERWELVEYIRHLDK